MNGVNKTAVYPAPPVSRPVLESSNAGLMTEAALLVNDQQGRDLEMSQSESAQNRQRTKSGKLAPLVSSQPVKNPEQVSLVSASPKKPERNQEANNGVSRKRQAQTICDTTSTGDGSDTAEKTRLDGKELQVGDSVLHADDVQKPTALPLYSGPVPASPPRLDPAAETALPADEKQSHTGPGRILRILVAPRLGFLQPRKIRFRIRCARSTGR